VKFRIRRPSPALFVAILALIVAMGGSAIAIGSSQSGDTLIAKRTLSGNRLRLHTVTGSEVASLHWHPLQLINGWTNYNGNVRAPAYAVDVQGVVHFRGAVHHPGTANTSMVFATVPVAVRPNVDVWLTTNAVDATPARLDLDHTGTLDAECPAGDSAARSFFNLDGVTYSPR
jgi:hypothetical protein